MMSQDYFYHFARIINKCTRASVFWRCIKFVYFGTIQCLNLKIIDFSHRKVSLEVKKICELFFTSKTAERQRNLCTTEGGYFCLAFMDRPRSEGYLEALEKIEMQDLQILQNPNSRTVSKCGQRWATPGYEAYNTRQSSHKYHFLRQYSMKSS